MEDLYNKLYNLTEVIYDLYDKLISLEYNDMQNTKQYKEQVENIKVCKYLEEEYYKALDRCSMDRLVKYINKINVDDYASYDDSDFDFAIFHDSKLEFVRRRIFGRLIDIKNQKETVDFYTDIISSEIVPLYNNSFTLKNHIVIVADRAKKICDMLWNINDNILIRYLLFVQSNIDKGKYKSFYVTNKYKTIFINTNIENNLIENNFVIDDNSNIDFPFVDILDTEIYTAISDMCMSSEINILIDDIKQEESEDKIDYILEDAFKTKLKANSYYISDDWRDMILSSMEGDNSVKHLVKIIKQ